MANERFTDLPIVATAQLDDIICAVQGYQSPTILGVSVQETLRQVFELFQSNVILSFAGNPNTNVAGVTYQLCWDTIDSIMWVCTTSGSDLTAIWTKVITLTAGAGISISQAGSTIAISATGVGIIWNNITTTPVTMIAGNGYKVNSVLTISLALPIASLFGDVINIMGFGSGGWTITQGAGQSIIIGSIRSTTGVLGSVSSTNQFDSVVLVCMEDNLTWQCLGAPQGNLLLA